jgi:hypothetical protein
LKGHAKRSPEERSESARKGIETRNRNRATRCDAASEAR